MNELKTVLLSGMKPPFKKVHIQINAGYVGGEGWTVDSEPFNTEIALLFRNNGWTLCIPYKNSCSCIKAYKNNQYLYLHPRCIDGYIDVKNEDEIMGILKEANTFKTEGLSYSDDVYDISDNFMTSLYTKHIEEINKLVLLFFKEKRSFYDVFDVLYIKSKISRKGEIYGYSSCDAQYQSLELIVKTLISNGLIKKYKDGSFATVKKYLPV